MRDRTTRTVDDIVQAICRLPVDFHTVDKSVVQLVSESGYAAVRSQITADRVTRCLAENPEWASAWAEYSGDKRTDGWYLSEDGLHVGFFGRRGFRIDPLRFRDPIEACAEFVVREVEDISRWPFGTRPPGAPGVLPSISEVVRSLRRIRRSKRR